MPDRIPTLRRLAACVVASWLAAVGFARSSHAACPSNASTEGCWEPTLNCGEEYLNCPIGWPAHVEAIHMILLRTGKVLIYNATHFGGRPSAIFDPVTQVGTRLDSIPDNLFCGGHAVLDDGRVLSLGGDLLPTPCPTGADAGIDAVYTLDPTAPNPQWSMLPYEMHSYRYYPTCTVLPNGKVLITSGGNCGVTQAVPEVFDRLAIGDPFTELTTAATTRYLPPWYPFMFVLKDGKVLHAGPHLSQFDPSITPGAMQILDPASSQGWLDYGVSGLRGGSAVMYTTRDPANGGQAMILKCGGLRTGAVINGDSVVNGVEIIRENGTRITLPPMLRKRINHNCTILADGTILITGGSSTIPGYLDDAVLDAELFNPYTPFNQRTLMSPSPTARMYHSTALLLPDGRVLSAGGEHCVVYVDSLQRCTSSYNEDTADFFSPPYLFKNNQPITYADRPQVSGVPAAISCGSTFTIQVTPPAGQTIGKACLIRPGAVTHANNMEQRYIPLNFVPGPGPGQLTLTAPESPEEAPPGYYMLFVLSNDTSSPTTVLRPSKAAFVRVWGIFEGSVHKSVQERCVGGRRVVEFDVSWETSVPTTGLDSLKLCRTDNAVCGGPTMAFATAPAQGRFHHIAWQTDCPTGAMEYTLQSSVDGSIRAITTPFQIVCITCRRDERDEIIYGAGGTVARNFLAGGSPNPFNPSTRIDFGVQHPSQVALGIYDMAGRQVRDLLGLRLEAGRHSRDWDGRDDRGHPVSAGIYVVRLRVDSELLQRKIVLVK